MKSFHISKTDLKTTAINLVRDLSIAIEYTAAVVLISTIFFHLSNSVTNISIIYTLAIIMIVRATSCYGTGILTSLFDAFWINSVLTYPYLTLNFTMPGYSVTFLGMALIPSLSSNVCIMTTEQSVQLQEKDRVLLSTEKEAIRINLVWAMSYDPRTPLTNTIGSSFAYLSQEEYMSPEEKRKLVRNIEENAQWLLNVVGGLFLVARIQDGEGIALVVKVDESLEEVTSGSVRRFRKRFPDVQVRASIPGSVIVIPMDATLIEQVISNLLENALFHSGTNEPTELMAATEKSGLSVSVRGFGEEIASNLLGTIFDGGGTSENHTEGGYKGMGIGLSICKTIISVHGDGIHAGNHPRGAQLAFTLPSWREYQNMNTKANIIIIEDEENIRNFIKTVLSLQGYQVTSAHTGTDRPKLIESLRSDVVLLDLGLPDMNGLELIQEVRSTSTLPIIMIPAGILGRNKVAALDLGTDDYLTKPFGTAELLARIHTALRHSQRVAGTQSLKYETGDLLIDFERRLVEVKGQDVHLTQIKYKLVLLLVQNAGRVMTYESIIFKIWGPSADSDNQIPCVSMAYIRRKLEENPAKPQYVFTEIEADYRIREE